MDHERKGLWDCHITRKEALPQGESRQTKERGAWEVHYGICKIKL